MTDVDQALTVAEAYEAAYRFVWQYAEREPSLESLQLLLVAMEPVDDAARTNDPASWSDWMGCVAEVGRKPVPRFPKG